MRLELDEIALAAGSFRLGPISLLAGDGEYLIVLGPTGSGKTLTLQAIAGLCRLSGGRVAMDGLDVTSAAPETRRIGYLFQDSLLFPHLSVRRNIAYGAHRIPAREREATVARVARALGVEALLERMPVGLSGGERQRVALARALATNPGLLLLDEPTASLDPNARSALRATLRELHHELGTTTVHVTHSFSEALTLGDRVAVLIDGRILQAGPTREVFAHPASPVIAGFLRSAVRGAREELPDPGGGAITILPGGLKLEMNAGPGRMSAPVLKADSAALALPANAPPGGGSVAGRIVAVESDGISLTVTLDVGLKLTARVPLTEPGAKWLVEGTAVWMRLPPDA